MRTSAYVSAMLLASAQAAPTKAEIVQVVLGLYEGALHTEGLDDVVTCTVLDGAMIAMDLEDAITQFKTKSVKGVSTGLEDIADAFTVADQALQLCTSPKDVAKYKKLAALLATFKNPKTFAMHVGKDILVNGKDIYEHINLAIKDYDNKNWMQFGNDIGVALAEVAIGTETLELKETKKQEAIEIAFGILKGAVEAEGLTNIENCVKDGEIIVGDAEAAIADFEKHTAAGALDGLKELASTVKEIEKAGKDCQGVVADWKKIEKMISIFDSPMSFAYHVGKDLIVNGVQIYHDVDDSIGQYKNGQYEAFGEDVGDALAKLILGGADEVQEMKPEAFLF